MRASAIAHHSPFRWVRCPGAVVGARGFEPPTSCSQSRCATRLRHAPEPQARDISARASGCSRSELLRATDAPSRLSGAAVMAAGDLPVDDFALQQLEDAAEQIAAARIAENPCATAVTANPSSVRMRSISWRRLASSSMTRICFPSGYMCCSLLPIHSRLEWYCAKALAVSLTAKMFRCGYHQSLAS